MGDKAVNIAISMSRSGGSGKAVGFGARGAAGVRFPIMPATLPTVNRNAPPSYSS
jgi:hypothetical protein